ncbi:hypothetical protein [Vandammella animalimorsus]|uniref:Uncharacterized protein n=1 Tax=Vandammella animalimorsus TaxID=2029117 RepID=A0A2A2ATT9_9BURK|nr:hypothetical protein [Vandammella animalimorsus]PAT41069.1 hypothetical protein CK621_13230 [Vandammella animalimorsus]
MHSPVAQELIIGLLSGLAMGPLGLVLWPLSTWACERLLRGFGQDSFAAFLLHFLWGALTLLAWIGLPMLTVQWVLAHWGIQGMEVHAVWSAYRPVSAAAHVSFAGALAGLALAWRLGRVASIGRLAQRCKAWLERRLGL